MQYQNYMSDAQEQIKSHVVKSAYTLFLQNGIENVKMTDVAKAAEVGVASIYRYFGTKNVLVIRAGELLWQQAARLIYSLVEDPVYIEKNGFMQAKALLKLILTAYGEHPDFLRFLRNFDAYTAAEHTSHEDLLSYENSILDLKTIAENAFYKGVGDGTIRADIDVSAFYFTTTHALLCLAQKLVCDGDVLTSDADVSGQTQLHTLIDMALGYVKAR